MKQAPFESGSQSQETVKPGLFDLIRMLRSAAGPLLSQSALHVQLARVEWAEEQNRLLRMLLVLLLGYACLLCAMLFGGALIVAVSWNADLHIPVLMALILLFGLGIGYAWQRFRLLSIQGEQAFAATKEEIAADIALLKSKL